VIRGRFQGQLREPVISDPSSVISGENSGQKSEVVEVRIRVKARFGDYELLEEIAHGGWGWFIGPVRSA